MLLSLIEMAGNKALEFDQASVARLEKLHGKTMTLHVKTLNQSVTLSPRPEGIEFSSMAPDNVDVTLSTTLGAMIKISRDGLENAELESGELEMSGDPIIGQRFAQIIGELDINWQALLSEQIGDTPAKTVTMISNQAMAMASEGRGRLHEYVQSLIKDDMQIVVSKEQVEPFLDGVDNLRAHVDQLSAKIETLRAKLDQ